MVDNTSESIKIKAQVGDPFKIRIWEDRTKGGCRWVPTHDTSAIRLLGDEYERTRNIRVSDIGMRYFEFVAIKPGTSIITFEARYGWKFSAESHLTYEVSISE